MHEYMSKTNYPISSNSHSGGRGGLQNQPNIRDAYKGVGTVRAIFGPVQDTAVFVIFCLNMLCFSGKI